MNTVSSICADLQLERPRMLDFNQQIDAAQRTRQLPYLIRDPEKKSENHNADERTGDSTSREDRWSSSRQDSSGDDLSAPYSPQSLSSETATRTASQAQPKQLSPDEKALISRLEKRDDEVRSHEQAHAAALGSYAGAITYTYQIGPDGKAYAIGGSTEVKPAQGKDPARKIEWARTVQRAVHAAGDASIADKAAASDAARIELKIRQLVDLIA